MLQRLPGRSRKPGSYTDEIHTGADYTPEELAFLRAMDQYKREHRRPFPSWREVLDVLRSLGWRPPVEG